MSKMLGMMVAGALGALSRHVLSAVIQSKSGFSFPLGTMVVNVLGCMVFGFLWSLANERGILSGPMAFVVLTGFVGSFTTFSTMTFEAFNLFSSSALGTGMAYLLGCQILGVGAAWAGVAFARGL